MDVHQRLNQILSERRWTRYRLSKESKLAPETLTNIYKRGTMPSIATLEAICNGFKISLSQFFAEGEMVELTPELKELFENWVFLTSNQKEAIILTMKSMNENKNKE